jgi:hypothetical protein
MKRLGAYVSDKTHALLIEWARQNGQSRSALLNYIIQRAIDDAVEKGEFDAPGDWRQIDVSGDDKD